MKMRFLLSAFLQIPISHQSFICRECRTEASFTFLGSGKLGIMQFMRVGSGGAAVITRGKVFAGLARLLSDECCTQVFVLTSRGGVIEKGREISWGELNGRGDCILDKELLGDARENRSRKKVLQKIV
jgi:hypothetical protein